MSASLVLQSCQTLCYPAVRQAPLSMGFPRQKYCSGLLFPSPGIFLTQGSNQSLLRWQADSLPLSHLGSPCFSSVQFSRSVVSDSSRPHESQHARPLCPSPTPGVHSDSTSIESVMPSVSTIIPTCLYTRMPCLNKCWLIGFTVMILELKWTIGMTI